MPVVCFFYFGIAIIFKIFYQAAVMFARMAHIETGCGITVIFIRTILWG
jgi:hypothetical protein